MRFDEDRIDLEEVSVSRDIHLVIVDLQAHKNTREILSRLNDCFPVAKNAIQRDVQHYLGEMNREIVTKAADALAQGDAQELGRLMQEAQEKFWKIPIILAGIPPKNQTSNRHATFFQG